MKYLISRIFLLLSVMLLLEACSATRSPKSISISPPGNSTAANKVARENAIVPPVTINTTNVAADSVINFAETLVGIKYKYGSTVKEQGFDCSGFINYVFNHFNIHVPRLTRDFTNAGTPVSIQESKPGDLILFTGTDTTGWVVGHMGMITQNDNGKIKFIHSSSGRSIGVIISPMSKYYETRFVKVIRVFQE